LSPDLIITVVKSGQLLKQFLEKLFANGTVINSSMYFAINVIVVKFVQLAKALNPIIVTESGITTVGNLEQSPKASEPICVTELGIITFVNPEQPLKAKFPIPTTELGIVTLLIFA
jgi:hypothetical protein